MLKFNIPMRANGILNFNMNEMYAIQNYLHEEPNIILIRCLKAYQPLIRNVIYTSK